MPTERIPGKPSTRRYTPAEKEQAVRLVRTLRAELGTEHGTIQVVAAQLGYGVESVRSWVRQADIDDGQKPGVTTAGAQRIKTHEQRNVLAKVPTHAQADVKGDYWVIIDPIEGDGPKALAEGRRRARRSIGKWKPLYPSAVACVEENLEASLVYLAFSTEHHKRIQHSNLIERTFGETRRRVKVIGRLRASRAASASSGRCSIAPQRAGRRSRCRSRPSGSSRTCEVSCSKRRAAARRGRGGDHRDCYSRA